MSAYKDITDEASPEDLVTMALSELEEVAKEISNWRDGMMGTNLESSEKYQMLDDAHNTLTSLPTIDPDVWPHAESRVTYSQRVPKRKTRSPSRMVRVENAIEKVAALVNFYENLDDAEDHSDLIEELREIADLSVELPGMYG